MSALPHTIASPPVIGPVLRQERIEAIDILRGVAILGILIVNMGGFSLPEDLPAQQLWPTMVDGTVEKLILFFAQEKFKSLFSFLFGVGLAVQMMRAEARGARFLPLYLRRLCVLLLIGVAHFLPYAAVGALIVLAPPRLNRLARPEATTKLEGFGCRALSVHSFRRCFYNFSAQRGEVTDNESILKG